MTIQELYEYAKKHGYEHRKIIITGYDGDLYELTEDIIKEPDDVEGEFDRDDIPDDAIVFDMGYC